MRKIALFVEDDAHRQVIGTLTQRLADERQIHINLDWRNATRGHGKVIQEFKDYLRDVKKQGEPLPDLIIVATDANCEGWKDRVKEINIPNPPASIVFAIPDPHIERWLLLDGAAFKAIFNKGCKAPDIKCNRDRYKQQLIQAIQSAGTTPNLGGIEFAKDIVRKMNIQRAKNADSSFQRFVDNLLHKFRCWKLEKQSNSTQ